MDKRRKVADRMTVEFNTWHDRAMSGKPVSNNPRTIAEAAFEAGWRSAFEVVLDERRRKPQNVINA